MSFIVIQYIFSAGQTIIASQHNANNTAITQVVNGGLDNTNMSATAGLLYSQLNLGGNIVNADISTSAAIAGTKIASLATSQLTGQFTPQQLANGTATTGLALVSSGTNSIPTWATVGRFVPNSMQMFTAGTTWTVPNNISTVYVKVWGGGGGGDRGTGATNVGGGGGSGGYTEGVTTLVGGTVLITIGSGGGGGSGGNALAGGTSIFGGVITILAMGGGAANNDTAGIGANAASVSGAINLPGFQGTPGSALSAVVDYISGGNAVMMVGQGGVTLATGGNGTGYSSGGGAGFGNGGSGGNGASGLVIVYY